ncbi:MAG: hypothetical protein ACETWB_05720 [Anaerolineae bacterium]
MFNEKKREGRVASDAAIGVIRASEIGQYGYCARAWWLARVRGLSPQNIEEMEDGRTRHENHGRAVAGYHRLQRLAYLLWISAAITGVLLIWSLTGGF